MAAGANSRDRSLEAVLQTLLDEVAQLKKPKSIHIGGIGGGVGGSGYTLSVNATGQLVATSDNGTVTVVNPGP